MIKQTGTPETIHVANYFLHSGHFDLGELVAEARKAKQREYGDGWDESNSDLADELASAVGDEAEDRLFSCIDGILDIYGCCFADVEGSLTSPSQSNSAT